MRGRRSATQALRTALRTAVPAALLGAALAAAPAPASAHADGVGGPARAGDLSTQAGCVTPTEYARATAGMRTARVNRLFGTRGRQTRYLELGGTVFTERMYSTCDSPGGFVRVSFTNGRLTVKLALWR